MSLEAAKDVFNKKPGDPSRNWITVERMKTFTDIVYSDVPSDSLTQAEVEAMVVAAVGGLTLTEDQIDAIIAQVGDLSSYVTSDDVNAAITAAVAALPESVTKEDVDQAVADAVAALPPPEFSDQSPVVVTSAPVLQQSNGEVIGLDSEGAYNVPEIVGAIPVTVNGVEYLIPLIEK